MVLGSPDIQWTTTIPKPKKCMKGYFKKMFGFLHAQAKHWWSKSDPLDSRNKIETHISDV